jgi:DivIVA domain-containing protein
MWFFGLVVVVLIGAVAVVASGRWGGMSPAYDDRPDVSLPARQVLSSDDIATTRFAVALRGYRMDEVDGLLERLGRELAERDRRIADLERALTPILHGPEGAGFASRADYDPTDFDDTGYQKPIMVGGDFPTAEPWTPAAEDHAAAEPQQPATEPQSPASQSDTEAQSATEQRPPASQPDAGAQFTAEPRPPVADLAQPAAAPEALAAQSEAQPPQPDPLSPRADFAGSADSLPPQPEPGLPPEPVLPPEPEPVHPPEPEPTLPPQPEPVLPPDPALRSQTEATPYAAPTDVQADPYAAPATQQADPYAAPAAGPAQAIPYADSADATTSPQADPYDALGASQANPYEAPAVQADPYEAPASAPDAQADPYVAPVEPAAAPGWGGVAEAYPIRQVDEYSPTLDQLGMQEPAAAPASDPEPEPWFQHVPPPAPPQAEQLPLDAPTDAAGQPAETDSGDAEGIWRPAAGSAPADPAGTGQGTVEDAPPGPGDAGPGLAGPASGESAGELGGNGEAGDDSEGAPRGRHSAAPDVVRRPGL